ncbi:hypothetical protein ACWN8V_07740 [Vagococcus elongatus]|uniref:Uncharacterized protein n=1 Tax=Vagococcus elongatus TaxID=180344 RepID=A0A430AU19_9ENTE|nr:hypothetical protein [Vagococcus elongatus]RSU11551.1 hypothetical protein CBF29_07670 [Vagococcus elongatus]
MKLEGKTISSENLQDQCTSLTSCSHQLSLINNYLSCLALQHIQSKDSREGHAYILHSLFNEKGLDNLMEVIESIDTKIVEIGNYLCDVEEIIND